MIKLRRRRGRIAAPTPFGVTVHKTGSRAGAAPFLIIRLELLSGRAARATRAKLEADHHRFRFQPNAPNFFHAMLNLIFQG
jgi:hypothetical protein